MNSENQQPETRPILRYSLGLGLAFELITLVFRFCFKFRSSEATASSIGVITLGLRIHHGYIGVLLVLVALYISRRNKSLGELLMIPGIALFLSDAVHHFLVLWWVTGSPEFDFFYSKPV